MRRKRAEIVFDACFFAQRNNEKNPEMHRTSEKWTISAPHFSIACLIYGAISDKKSIRCIPIVRQIDTMIAKK
ncbi:hypothetical protein J3R80_14095 [Aliiroseovarius sp. Z3]|uniref:hypothetical protein n=1 Tax=Aliiroseovarius sp. Z3 TaxID=2811402 RepID=UPI0023B2C7C5|nr:hypothetical protein [Aliiroseovarius sp. Z3]MDE9451602.1 hypothetical protein [Aliiroseovarius sp. Z3]